MITFSSSFVCLFLFSLSFLFLFAHIALSTCTKRTERARERERDSANEKILNREYAPERRGSFFYSPLALCLAILVHSILRNRFRFEMRFVYLLLVCFINNTFTTKRLNLSLRECGKDTIFPMKIATTRFRLNVIASQCKHAPTYESHNH